MWVVAVLFVVYFAIDPSPPAELTRADPAG